MIRHILFWALVATCHIATTVNAADAESRLRILLTVGGVGYHTSIIRELQSSEHLEVTVGDIDDGAVLFTADALSDVDAVLMYHRDNVAESEERDALMEFIANGGGVVVLHHSIANYPDWESWWRDQVGGLYVLSGHEGHEPSRYFYDFRGVARPATDHPITKRIGSLWRYADESYSQLWVSDDVTVLLSTTAFGSDEKLAWIGPSESERVVYIQPGHTDRVLTDSKFLALVEDALRWTARGED